MKTFLVNETLISVCDVHVYHCVRLLSLGVTDVAFYEVPIVTEMKKQTAVTAYCNQ